MKTHSCIKQEAYKSATRKLRDFRKFWKRMRLHFWDDFFSFCKNYRRKVMQVESKLISKLLNCSGKTLVNHRRVSLGNKENFLLHSITVTKDWLGGPFCFSGGLWCFCKFLAMPICQAQSVWWTIEGGITKLWWKHFFMRKFVGGPFWCFWKILISMNYT